MSSPEKIGLIVKSFLSERGYLTVCRENEIIDKWKLIVGDKISSISKCTSVENGILFVSVYSSSWRNEIHFFKKTILNKIHNDFDCKSIKDIIFL